MPKKRTPPDKGGRPTLYSAEVGESICARLSLGESLRSICADPEMPGQRTVFDWLSENRGEFPQQYARAREVQAEALFDEVIDIADDGHNDWMLRKYGDDERWIENGEALRRSQLRIEARKWMAGKLAPKKYGDRIQAEVSGPDGGPIQMVDVSKLSDEQLAALEPVLRALAGASGSSAESDGGTP